MQMATTDRSLVPWAVAYPLMYCTVMICTILYCTLLDGNVPNCTLQLYSTVLYCTSLCCPIQSSSWLISVLWHTPVHTALQQLTQAGWPLTLTLTLEALDCH